jgi:hypothetical protein
MDEPSNNIISKNRCVYIKNNKQCRAKTKNNDLFCCKNHEPINKELVENGCFICMEKIEKSNELLYFKCHHAVHKPCYIDWLEFSTYEEPICVICRNVTYPRKIEHTKTKKYKLVEDNTNIKNILSILKNI